MRLLSTIEDPNAAYQFSAFLAKKGIANRCEVSKNTDWGSDDYGMIACRIWVLDEDDYENALQDFQRFKQNPNDPYFAKSPQQAPRLEKRPIEPDIQPEPMGPATLYTVILCVILFTLMRLTGPEVRPLPPNIPYMPVYAPPLQRNLLFDWPKAYQILGDIAKTYGVEKLQDPSTLPPEGKAQLVQFFQTPYWQGLYDKVVDWLKHKKPPQEEAAPLFEKIRQGEVWRLFTPCLLHADIFHLLFNMIWLVLIGKQLENRIGIPNYILFILITGVFSNTAQYLVSGANFIGFSGILCAMLAFVWVRQLVAPYEGYHLQSGTAAFVLFFVATMFLIQFFAFILQVTSSSTLSLNIANTAHIAGGVLGYLLGRSRLIPAK